MPAGGMADDRRRPAAAHVSHSILEQKDP